jgi:RNA polymerase sigma-70 factor, ECF subfamily
MESVKTSMIEEEQLSVRVGLAEHLTRLWRYGLVLSGNRDTAEDLVRATCVRALEHTCQFAAGSRLDKWLLSILRCIWLSERRSCRTHQEENWIDAELTSVCEGADKIEINTTARPVLNVVGLLPQAQREVLFLVYIEGLTYNETAEMLDVPMGTVMNRLATARERLRQAI